MFKNLFKSFGRTPFAVMITDPVTKEVNFVQKVFYSRDEAEVVAERIRKDYASRGNFSALGVEVVKRDDKSKLGYVPVTEGD